MYRETVPLTKKPHLAPEKPHLSLYEELMVRCPGTKINSFLFLSKHFTEKFALSILFKAAGNLQGANFVGFFFVKQLTTLI